MIDRSMMCCKPPADLPGRTASKHQAFWIPALLILLLASCGKEPTWVNDDGPLILITIDTLRADHLSSYGYEALDTPHIDSLAAEGVLFEDTSTTMPMTLPAHATIMTGLTPPVHGVRDNQDYFLPDPDCLVALFVLGNIEDATGNRAEAFLKHR